MQTNSGKVSYIDLQHHLDHTGNFYLSMAAILACGIDGLRRTIKIPPPIEVDPSTLDEQARRAKHVRLLPMSMEDRKAFVVGGEIGKPIRDFFG